MKIECPHCGLANWAGVSVCVRCKKAPDEPVAFQPAEEKFGVERLEAQMGGAKMPIGSKVLLGVMMAGAAFGLFNYMRSGPSPTSAAAAAPRGVNANPPVSANANAAIVTADSPAFANLMKATPLPITTVAPLSDAEMKRMYDNAIDAQRQSR